MVTTPHRHARHRRPDHPDPHPRTRHRPVNAFLLPDDEPLLDGPAGGTFSRGVDGERVEIDALDLIRTMSGRLPDTGVLTNPLPL